MANAIYKTEKRNEREERYLPNYRCVHVHVIQCYNITIRMYKELGLKIFNPVTMLCNVIEYGVCTQNLG